MIAAAADACEVQEHQTSAKANHELPTELQISQVQFKLQLKTTDHNNTQGHNIRGNFSQSCQEMQKTWISITFPHAA